MGMIDAAAKLTTFAAALVPPATSTPKAQYQWRLRVGVLCCSMFCAWVYIGAGILGYVPSLVARAGDIAEIDGKLKLVALQVQSVADDGKRTRLSMLTPQILDMQIRYCAAHGRTGQVTVRSLYRQQIDELLDEYLSLKGQPFRLPSCGEL